MAANIRCTRPRLSATACGLASNAASHAGCTPAVADESEIVESVEIMFVFGHYRSACTRQTAGGSKLFAFHCRLPTALGIVPKDVAMTEWIWINGKTMLLADARVGIEDRGFQFADGVYEVIKLYDGVPFTLTEHLERLERSAAAVEITLPLGIDSLAVEIRKLIAHSGIGEGMIYLQLTRGAAPRNHVIPDDISPTLLFYPRPLPVIPAPGTAPGAKLLSVADERWRRCWIKTIALLPNILAKTQAVRGGYDEAVFIENSNVSECSASNLFIVSKGKLITHPVGPKVLPGITRAVLLECAVELQIPFEERAISETEAKSADELFITSTTREVSWVSHWNESAVGGSRCGPITLALHRALQARVQQETKRASFPKMEVA